MRLGSGMSTPSLAVGASLRRERWSVVPRLGRCRLRRPLEAFQFKRRFDNHLAPTRLEIDAREIVGRDLQRIDDETGALGVNALIHERADDLAQLQLDGVTVLQQRENVDPRAEQGVVKVAEAFAAQRGRAAADAVGQSW